MFANESAPAGRESGEGGEQVGETGISVAAPADHARRSRRWAAAHLDELLDVPPPPADLIDYAAAGLTLTVAERDAAGAVHPWRIGAAA